MSQPVPQRLDAAFFLVGECRVHQEGEPIADFQRSALGHNMIMPQLLKNFGFVPQSGIVMGLTGDLQYELLALFLDQQYNGTAPLSQTANHAKATGKLIILLGPSGVVGERFQFWCGRLVFDFFQ